MIPYYEQGGITIYHGDALEALPLIPRATCVALDPPYATIPNSRGGKDDGAAGTSGAPVRLLIETLHHARRLLPDGGVAGIICDWRRLPDVSYLATLTGLRIATCVAWTRKAAGLGGIFRSAWDPLLILSVGTPTIRDKAAIRNVVEVEKTRGCAHPYEKPAAVWQHLFDRLPPGLVVDPYMGTGSSLLAAVRTGHHAIGIEIEERYCEIAAKRLQQSVMALV